MELEAEASVERTYQLQLIPGILQTPEYFAALAQAWIPAPSREIIRQRAEVRAARQTRLASDSPLHVHAIIWESALLTQIGGSEVMSKQIRHLRRMAQLPNVTIQVLPVPCGAHPAAGTSFEVLSFTEDHLDDVVYIETLSRGDYIEDLGTVQSYILNFDGTAAAALDTEASASLLTALTD